MSQTTSPRHFLLVTIGSAGDVLPFVGLGRELRRRGHRVTLITGGYFEPLIRRNGLDFAEIISRDEYLSMIDHPDLWHPFRAPRFIMQNAVAPMIRRVYDVVTTLHEPGRTTVAASTLSLGARIAEEAHGIPTATIHLQPAVIRSIVAPPTLAGMLAGPRVPRAVVRAQFWLADKLVVDRLLCPELNGLRRELRLPPVSRVFGDYLHSTSQTIGLFPAWFAPPQPDWPRHLQLTGFPLFDEQELTPLDDDLRRFLADGDRPIAFTPGSAMTQGRNFFAAAAEACRLLRRRGLLLTRHPEQLPKSLPAGVRHVEFAPFTHLLPQCAALVHHGGIGTMSQAFAAGIPQVVMPLAHDQQDNAARAERLGVSHTLPPKQFRGDRLAAMLRSLLDSRTVAATCGEFAARISGTSPLEQTADLLEGDPTPR